MRAMPAPLALAAMLIGAFFLGRGPGAVVLAVSIVLLIGGAATLAAMAHRRRRDRRALERAAYTDPLTGLGNRRLLMAMARHEIARHERLARQQRSGGRFAVLMLDLDGFKQLNDRFGHAAGDEMLREVANSLTSALRGQDTIVRLGGDEFCVIAPDTADPQALATRVRSAIAGAVSGYDALAATVGVAIFPEDGTEAEDLLLVADERLISGKRVRRAQSGCARTAA